MAWLTWQHHTYHFAVVQEGVLYRDGNQSMVAFSNALVRARPKTVVSLVDDQEFAQAQFHAEEQECQRRGIDLVRIRIAPGHWPESAQVQEFLKIAGDPGRQPVLVHCAQGVRRTGMMVAAFEESILHYDAAQAKAAILSFGHSAHTLDDVKKFIDLYDASSQTMKQVPAATSQE
jgi:protein tyrosine/serine phosphatase